MKLFVLLAVVLFSNVALAASSFQVKCEDAKNKANVLIEFDLEKKQMTYDGQVPKGSGETESIFAIEKIGRINMKRISTRTGVAKFKSFERSLYLFCGQGHGPCREWETFTYDFKTNTGFFKNVYTYRKFFGGKVTEYAVKLKCEIL